MQQILILGGGAAGLAAALAAAQTAEGRAHITVLEQNREGGQKASGHRQRALQSRQHGTSRRSGTSPADPQVPASAC
ncbi:MAG: FAD-dependent oxidoreductase [Faecalibacterium prausnitzii]